MLEIRLTIKKERKIKISPTIAQVSVFFAPSTFWGSPFDVIYLAPAKIIRKSATIPAKTRAALITFLMIIGIQDRVATPSSRHESHGIVYFLKSLICGNFRLNKLSPKSPSTKLRIKNARNTMISPITAAMI